MARAKFKDEKLWRCNGEEEDAIVRTKKIHVKSSDSTAEMGKKNRHSRQREKEKEREGKSWLIRDVRKKRLGEKTKHAHTDTNTRLCTLSQGPNDSYWFSHFRITTCGWYMYTILIFHSFSLFFSLLYRTYMWARTLQAFRGNLLSLVHGRD